MSPEEQAKYHEVMDWYEVERRNKEADVVQLIHERLANSKDVVEKKAYLQALEIELKIQQRFDEAEDILHQMIVLDTIDPLPLIGLATLRLHFQDNPEQALKDINQAFKVAQTSGNFRRHALNTKARVLLKLADYRALERCLLDIVETKILPGQLDIRKERDFFDLIPPGSISHEARNLFLEYLA